MSATNPYFETLEHNRRHCRFVQTSICSSSRWSLAFLQLDKSRGFWRPAQECRHSDLYFCCCTSLHHFTKPGGFHFPSICRWHSNHCCVWSHSHFTSRYDTKRFPIFLFPPRKVCETILHMHFSFQRLGLCCELHSLSSVHQSYYWVQCKVMISPFYFPVDSNTFNFVSCIRTEKDNPLNHLPAIRLV